MKSDERGAILLLGTAESGEILPFAQLHIKLKLGAIKTTLFSFICGYCWQRGLVPIIPHERQGQRERPLSLVRALHLESSSAERAEAREGRSADRHTTLELGKERYEFCS